MAEKLDLQIIGRRGLKQYGGRIEEEFLRELKNDRRMKAYKEMYDNDPVIGAIFRAVDLLCRQVPWDVLPASEEKTDVEYAEFLEGCLEDMSDSWENTLSEILTFIPFGFSVTEIVYKKREGEKKDPSKRSNFTDGKIGWRKLSIRSQDTISRWEFDEEGGVAGVYQQPPPSYIEVLIPIEKALLFRTQSYKGNPEGKGVLRNCYRPYFFKKNFENLLGIGVERDLAGLPVIEGDPAILKQYETQLKEIVTNIRRDEQEGVVLPSPRGKDGNKLLELSLLSTGGQRQFDIKSLLEYYDQRIAMTVLADFITLGHDKTGSYALSSDKTNLFAVALGTYLDEVQAVMNRHAIPRLWRLNGFPMESIPSLEHGDIEKQSVKDLSEAFRNFAQAGYMPFPSPGGVVEQRVADMLDIPYVEDLEHST